MRDIKVASRYAKSLLKIAIEQNQLEKLHNDMQLIKTVCEENKELQLLLKSPIVKSDKKAIILSAIFEKSISDISKRFIAIILKKGREKLLVDITLSFNEIYKTHKHISTAKVTSAVKLSQQQKDAIIKLLESQHFKNVELMEEVDESVIGGLILKVGDKQVDESIKRKLSNLELVFSENPYIKEI